VNHTARLSHRTTPTHTAVKRTRMTLFTMEIKSAEATVGGKRLCAENNSVSLTVSVLSKRSSCSTYPTKDDVSSGKRWSGHVYAMWPDTTPDLARPAKMSSNVDFPAPEEPSRAIMSPGFSIPCTLCKILRRPAGSDDALTLGHIAQAAYINQSRRFKHVCGTKPVAKRAETGPEVP
jgi:hypothetical protein